MSRSIALARRARASSIPLSTTSFASRRRPLVPQQSHHPLSTLSPLIISPPKQPVMIKNVNLNGTQRRSYSKLQSMTSWVRDVLRTKSLQPPNPILTSIQEAAEDHSSDGGLVQHGNIVRNLPLDRGFGCCGADRNPQGIAKTRSSRLAMSSSMS